ncbi:MAG TPA: DinB family protein [Pyrinomonadaceae bacterium]|nr:DinB family protein [Chloracidobacterium sp.]HBE83516.1 hypothetical protein [Blastocatellia bacterium]HRJ89005.1 DinB family protein [Pyrinomonadaceae bacterium]HRK51591.1 DinB family protein [Pyrinomonadaceae bacterium]
MNTVFEIEEAIAILAVTPGTLKAWLGGLPDVWTASSGDENDWRPFDVVGHLIHGERTDWISRARIVLEQGENRTFEPFDRLAQFEHSRGKTLEELLDEFERLRSENLRLLSSWELGEEQFDLVGMHPALGPTTLRQLISTWAVHDLNHIKQIAASMAKRYDREVGPWKEYLSILR